MRCGAGAGAASSSSPWWLGRRGVEPQRLERRLHMGREVGFDSQAASGWMRQFQPSGVQVKIAGQTLHQCREREVLVRFLIFLVAEDGCLDGDAVHAKLMRA